MRQAGSIAAYRQSREKSEAHIARRDEETYVCPFFGIPRERSVPGCMIHPSITGNPHSQNFSFYGASICQAYDCPNKERDEKLLYSDFARRISGGDDSVYARLMADTRFLNMLLLIPNFFDRLAGARESGPEMKALEELARLRLLSGGSRGVTSFEFRKYSDAEAEFDDLFVDLAAEDRSRARQLYRSLV